MSKTLTGHDVLVYVKMS